MHVTFTLPGMAAHAVALGEVWEGLDFDAADHAYDGRRFYVRATKSEAEGILQALLDCSRDPARTQRQRSACRRGAQRIVQAMGNETKPRGVKYAAHARSTGALITVRRRRAADEVGRVLGGGGAARWRLHCDTHGTTAGCRTLDEARHYCRRPEEWCPHCGQRAGEVA